MIIQKRSMSLTLQIQESLNNRMNLSPEYKRKYNQNQIGYEGELTFDYCVEKVKLNCVILNDVRLKVDGNKVQIDSLFISENKVYIFEVKNYKGEFHYKNDLLHLDSGLEIFNPINQIERSRILLNKVLSSLKGNSTVQSIVVFVHPQFVLFQSQREERFILRNQLENHLEKMKRVASIYTQNPQRLAEKILNLQCPEEIRYEDFPNYDEQSLRKGITCKQCHSFSINNSRQSCRCIDCGYTEKISETINRSIQEYKLLFPDKEITKNRIYHWMNEIYSPQRIQRVLLKNYNLKGKSKASYYV